jgi:hypothetical protein
MDLRSLMVGYTNCLRRRYADGLQIAEVLQTNIRGRTIMIRGLVLLRIMPNILRSIFRSVHSFFVLFIQHVRLFATSIFFKCLERVLLRPTRC